MPAPTAFRRPLIIRLRHWVGDVTLGLPTLQRLHDAGYSLRLVGKGWAKDLLAGTGWPVHALPGTLRERVALLRRLRHEALAEDPGFTRRLNTLCLPYSFGSALECRLAGLRALGHAYEGRSLLLGRSVVRPTGQHELAVYWQLGSALLQAEAPLPTTLGLRPSPEQTAQAQGLMAAHGLAPGFIVLCPFAGGTYAGQDKTWPDFPAFAAALVARATHPVLLCPGPGEEETVAARDYPGCTVLRGVKLGTYAALLQQAAVMVANDTGPGHMAAAVGTPLLSVLGPSDPAQWGAWGPGVQYLQGPQPGAWPVLAQVNSALQAVLQTPPQRG